MERVNDTMNRVLISGAVGLLMAPAVEAGYTLAMSYPLESYAFTEAAFNGGYSPAALGIHTWAGRVGQGVEQVAKWLTN